MLRNIEIFGISSEEGTTGMPKELLKLFFFLNIKQSFFIGRSLCTMYVALLSHLLTGQYMTGKSHKGKSVSL